VTLAAIGFVTWLALLAEALYLLFRRPRVSAALFLAVGVWSVALRLTSAHASNANDVFIALGGASSWFVIGVTRLYRQQRTS